MRKLLLLMLLTASLGTHAAKNTLVYCSEGSPETFNPQLSTSGTTFDASSRQLYNRLFEFEIGTTNVINGLAENVQISEDGTKYTLFLRKGVKFHTTEYFTPSRDFNADDVVFTFNRQRDKSHPYFAVSGGVYKYFYDMGMDKLIVDIKKIDDYTVEFTLSKPESPFVANLAMDFASILSKEYADTLAQKGKQSEIDRLPVGTGPFKFKRYKKDAHIRYTAHEDYWRGKQAIDNLVFAITVDPTVRYARLRSGECHVMSYPIPSQLEGIKTNADVDLQEKPALTIGYWAFNLRKKPFDDIRVRKALNHAINKDAIIKTIFAGTGQAAKNFIPPIMWSYNDDVQDYDYSPEKAKALLAEAGLADGFEMDLWAMPVQRPYNPDARRMAEMMQADLKAIGISAKIVSYEWGAYLNKARNGEHETLLAGWNGDNGDPDNFFSPLLTCDAATAGGNFSFWCDKNFDDLIDKARRSSDIKERTHYYREAQVILKDQAPILTIAHAVRFQAKRKDVKGLEVDPLGGIYFENVSL